MKAIYQRLNHKYSDYRHKLHKVHYCKYDADEMRLDLATYFGSEDFKVCVLIKLFRVPFQSIIHTCISECRK